MFMWIQGDLTKYIINWDNLFLGCFLHLREYINRE